MLVPLSTATARTGELGCHSPLGLGVGRDPTIFQSVKDYLKKEHERWLTCAKLGEFQANSREESRRDHRGTFSSLLRAEKKPLCARACPQPGLEKENQTLDLFHSSLAFHACTKRVLMKIHV